jgi:hypothetical protein
MGTSLGLRVVGRRLREVDDDDDLSERQGAFG